MVYLDVHADIRDVFLNGLFVDQVEVSKLNQIYTQYHSENPRRFQPRNAHSSFAFTSFYNRRHTRIDTNTPEDSFEIRCQTV